MIVEYKILETIISKEIFNTLSKNYKAIQCRVELVNYKT